MNMHPFQTARIAPLLTIVAVCFCTWTVSAQEDGSVVATELHGPMGVIVTDDGSVWVVDTGVGGDKELEFINLNTRQPMTGTYGTSSRILRISPDGSSTTVASLPSLKTTPLDSFGGSRLAWLDGSLYATSGGWVEGPDADRPSLMGSVVQIEDGEAVELADTWKLEREENPAGYLVESNPFAMAGGPDGMLWITDAAGNTLLRIDPATGEMQVVAIFGGVESPIPNPFRNDARESDPVPTGLAFGDDGAAYVSFLPGFPFAPGSAKVVRVTPEGEVSDYATGLTMLTDLRRGPDGNLYAVSFGRFTEQGPVPNSGAVLRVHEGAASDTLVTELSFPTSIAFNASGDAYVTINGIGEPGSGQVLRYAGLAEGEGTQ